MNSTSLSRRAGLLLLGLGSCGLVQATELVYTPINPSFGGNPLNGTWLLNNAQAQNDYDDPDLKDRASAFSGTTALERFSNQGMRFFILGSDQAVLRTGWTQQVRHFHSLVR